MNDTSTAPPAALFIRQRPVAAFVILFCVAYTLLGMLDAVVLTESLDPRDEAGVMLPLGLAAVAFLGLRTWAGRVLPSAELQDLDTRIPFYGKIVLFLGLVYFLGLAGWSIQQVRIPERARVEALERRYAPQIERLRRYAKLPAGEQASAIRNNRAEDEGIFAPGEILSATVWRVHSANSRSGQAVKTETVESAFAQSCWFHADPAPGRAVVNLWTGAGRRVIEYNAAVESRGGDHAFTIRFDLDRIPE